MLDRIEVRRVGREGFQVKPRGPGEKVLDGTGTMKGDVIPKNDDRPGKVPQQLPEELGRGLAVDVVRREIEIQPATQALRADGEARDDGNPLMTVAVRQDRRLPFGRPGLADGRDEAEAGFVNEDEVGAQIFGVFFTLGHSSRVQRSIAALSRSLARRSGFWCDQPSEAMRRPI